MIRDKDEVSDEDKARNDWDSVDDDLISTSILEGDAYSRDNKRVVDLLKPFVMEGPGWPFVQPFNKKRDGRAAFKALKAQAEGRSAIATRKAKAYAMIATAMSKSLRVETDHMSQTWNNTVCMSCWPDPQLYWFIRTAGLGCAKKKN